MLAVSVVGGLVVGHRRGARHDRDRRHPHGLRGQPAAPAVRERRRHADPAALLPGRADLDRRLRPRPAARVHRPAHRLEAASAAATPRASPTCRRARARARRRRARAVAAASPTTCGCASAGATRSIGVVDRGAAGRGRRPHRHERRGQDHADERDLGVRQVVRRHRGVRPRASTAWRRTGAPRQGMGRAFQNARSFGGLTVRETVMVALEARQRSLPDPVAARVAAVAVRRAAQAQAGRRDHRLPRARALRRQPRERAVAPARGASSSSASLLALDARLILLDEPTAGVAQKETETFGPLIKTIQRELGSSILIIEHDMPMVMSISDRIYCLEAGAVIAEGTPDRGARRPRRSSPRTSAPTSAPSSARERPAWRRRWNRPSGDPRR